MIITMGVPDIILRRYKFYSYKIGLIRPLLKTMRNKTVKIIALTTISIYYLTINLIITLLLLC